MKRGRNELIARAGDLVPKPRGIRHAFWIAGDGTARVLEIITPAGFERFFARVAHNNRRSATNPADQRQRATTGRSR